MANLGQAGSVDLDAVNLQYWFNGPPNTPRAAEPLSQFDMVCLDATTGDIPAATMLSWRHAFCCTSWGNPVLECRHPA